MKSKLLLHLYPRRWRERYGEELLALTGDHLQWSSAMNLAKSALLQHLQPTLGGRPRPVLRALGAVLVGLAMFLLILVIGQTIATAQNTPLARAASESASAILKVAPPIAMVWLLFAFVTILLAIVVDRLGWRSRWPVASARFLQVAVFGGLVALEIAKAPSAAGTSPFFFQQVAVLDLLALVIGFVVVRSLFGKTRPGIVSHAS